MTFEPQAEECLLSEILLNVKGSPSLITISETRLSDNNINNISIPRYEFISKASKTNAGGVGMYIKDIPLSLSKDLT